jgi:hypothetical protein
MCYFSFSGWLHGEPKTDEASRGVSVKKPVHVARNTVSAFLKHPPRIFP